MHHRPAAGKQHRAQRAATAGAKKDQGAYLYLLHVSSKCVWAMWVAMMASRLNLLHLNLLLCHVNTDDRTLLPHQGCTHVAVPSTAAAQIQHAQSCKQAQETYG